MADSSGASKHPKTILPVHTPRIEREREEKKCMLATCAIWKKISGQGYSLVGTGSLVKDFFGNYGRSVHLITSDKVISSDDLSCYFLRFKKLDGRIKERRQLVSICDEVIYKSHGLAIVPVNPDKIDFVKKPTTGLLNHRPFTIRAERKEGLKYLCLYCHVVEGFDEKSFTTRVYKVMGIADEETYLADQLISPMKIDGASVYRGSQRGLGAPITITGERGVAEAVGVITLGNNQEISFVLFSQINRSPFPSVRRGAEGHQEPEETGVGGGEQPTKESGQGGREQLTGELAERRAEQPSGELAERREEQPTRELAERRAEQPTGELAERREEQPTEELAERREEQPTDCVKFASSYREETGKDTKHHSGDQHTSTQGIHCASFTVDKGCADASWSLDVNDTPPTHEQALGPSKANSPFTVLVSDASSSGEKGIRCVHFTVDKDCADASWSSDVNDLPPIHEQDFGGGTSGFLHMQKEENGTTVFCRTSEGKRVRQFRLQQYEKRAEIRANFRDTLERQGGQDIGNQQNSNPQQGPSLGGSGENSSFSSPGQDLGCGNDGSKKHGAGDHKIKGEKRKYDSGNKDKNVTSSYSKEARKEDTLKHSADQNTSAQGMPQQEPTPKQAISESSVYPLAEMNPNWAYTKEEKNIAVLFSDELPCDATSYKADFEGLGEANLELKNPYTLVGVSPISQIPREVTVKILKFTEDDRCVTFGEDLKLTYKDKMSELRKEVLACEKKRNAASEGPCKGLQSASAGSDDLNSFRLPGAGHPGRVRFMVTASSSFASTKETTNYARLCRLLVDVGSQVLRSTFDRIHPPATLHTVLECTSKYYAILLSLKKNKVLNLTHWGKLFPTHSSVSSADFDISLLTVLLRNICDLCPPYTGWNHLPCASDKSIAADIARLRYYRNSVFGHATKASLDENSFSAYWQEIREALVRLGGSHFRTIIDSVEHDCMDPDVENYYYDLMKQWQKDCDSIKDALENIISTFEYRTDMMGIEMREVKQELKLLTAAVVKSEQKGLDD